MDLVTRSQTLRSTIGDPPSDATLRWVAECLGPRAVVKMVRPLGGGRSRTNHALLVESRSGSVHRLVLRRWAGADRTAEQTEFSPEREIAALSLLVGCEVPTPSLVAADPAGAYCDAPTLLITRLTGHPPRPAPDDLAEYLIQLAAALLSVHAVRGADTMPHYVPHGLSASGRRLARRRPPALARRPDVWEHAFDLLTGGRPTAESCFIHGDYHPDNTLWSYGRLSGVVDWSDASYGPIAVDIAHMRWSLALRYGAPVADRFLTAFDRVSGGYEHHPYWDLNCLLGLLPEDADEATGEAQITLLEQHLAGVVAAAPW